jgi:predicted transcriptional regulator
MKYRSRYQIIAKILRVAKKGGTRTQIMFGAYLSSRQIREYLEFLKGKELLQFDGDSKRYTLTNRGLSLLKACERIDELITFEGGPDVDSDPSATVRTTAEDLAQPLEVAP